MSNSNDAEFSEGAELYVLVRSVRAHPWWIVTCIVAFSLILAAAAFLSTPIYRSTIVVIPAKTQSPLGSVTGDQPGIGAVASLVGIDLQNGSPLTQEALGVLQSRRFTEDFINARNLMPVLFASKWDSGAGKWRADVRRPPTLARGVKYFDKRIRTVAQDKKSGLIKVSIDWKDRNAASDWANDLISRLNQEMRQRELARSNAEVGYLEKELETTTTLTTREAIGRLIEAQLKQRMLVAVTPEYAFRVVDPAYSPDRDDRYSPSRLAMLMAGPIIGLVAGILLAWGHTKLTDGRRPELTSR